MLTMEEERQPMGSTMRQWPAEKSPLEIEVHLQSLEAIRSLELDAYGEIVRQEAIAAPMAGTAIKHKVTWSMQPRRSGWYVARALYLAPDGRLRQAHTSPVYVVIDDQPIAFRKSAEYMIRWIDRLIEVAEMPARY